MTTASTARVVLEASGRTPEREITRALRLALHRQPRRRTLRDRWLITHRLHGRLEGRDNHDHCYGCGADFYRPNQ